MRSKLSAWKVCGPVTAPSSGELQSPEIMQVNDALYLVAGGGDDERRDLFLFHEDES
jgi:hypothetical protein